MFSRSFYNCERCGWSGSSLLYLSSGQGTCPVCCQPFRGCFHPDILDQQRIGNTRIHSLPATAMLMLVINDSPIAFTVQGSATQQNIDIYTNDPNRFNKDIDISQNSDVTALAVNIRKNPKYNVIINRGIVQGQVIGEHNRVTQRFHGNVMHQEATTDLSIVIMVPEDIDVNVYNAINIDIKGVKGNIEQ